LRRRKMIGSLLLRLSSWMIDMSRRSRSPWSRRLWTRLSDRLLGLERALAELPRTAPSGAGVTARSAIMVYRSTVSSAERLVALPSTFAAQFASSDWEATDEEYVATPDISRDLLKQGYSFFKAGAAGLDD